MGTPRPLVVDLFAGAGGFSLGFEQAGFDVAVAVEIDPVHACVHKFNFPECAVLPRSVVDLSAQEIRLAGGVGNKPIDVVVGGAPCQGFSLIGHRAIDDPRNALVREFVRIVADLRASYFVFENVKGLAVGKHRQLLEELIEAFEARGYDVRLPWQVLNAADFGVPQDRKRLILLGARKGLPVPQYPNPVTAAAGARRLSPLPRGPSCREALADLPDAERYDELRTRDWVHAYDWGAAGAYARDMRCLDDSSWRFGYPREWTPSLLTSSLRTDHTAISRRRFAATPAGDTEPISRFYKLSADGICNTLRAGTDSARGAFTSPRPIHYDSPRCITVREMARLHGIPDWFRLHATKWHGARQIGNAVPPPLATHIASTIAWALGYAPTPPERPLELGCARLLSMDMSEAAEFWRVPVPIGRRDRKSGAKKRRQVDIEAERLALHRGMSDG